MKKAVAMVLVVVMMLAFGVTAFAAKGPLTVEQAKQVALDYAGVKAADATFTKAQFTRSSSTQTTPSMTWMSM